MSIYRDIIHNCLKSQQTTLLVIVIVVPWEAQLYNAWFKKLSHLHSVIDMFISRNQKVVLKCIHKPRQQRKIKITNNFRVMLNA